MNILTDEEKDHLCEYYYCSLYALNTIEKAVVEKLEARAKDLWLNDHGDMDKRQYIDAIFEEGK